MAAPSVHRFLPVDLLDALPSFPQEPSSGAEGTNLSHVIGCVLAAALDRFQNFAGGTRAARKAAVARR